MIMGVVIGDGGEDAGVDWGGREEVWPLMMMAVAELGTEYVVPEMVAAGPPGVRVCDAMTIGVVGSPGSTLDCEEAGSPGALLVDVDVGAVVGSLFTGFWGALVVVSDGGLLIAGSCVLVAGSATACVLVAGSAAACVLVGGSIIT